MVTITSVDDKFFLLDDIQYARIYQPLKQGLNNVSILNIYDTKQKLINSTRYDEFIVDDLTYANQTLLIAALVSVTWNKYNEDDFDGLEVRIGVNEDDIDTLELRADALEANHIILESEVDATEVRVDNLEANQVTGVEVYSTLALLPVTGVLLVSYKVTNDPTPANNGYYHWNGTIYVKDADVQLDSAVLGNDIDGNGFKGTGFKAGETSGELTTYELTETYAINLIKLYNPTSLFVAFVNTSTPTPAHLNNRIYIATETGTIFGIGVTKGQLIYDDNVIFTAVTFNLTGYKIVVTVTNPNPNYIGQIGIDALGQKYMAIALTGTRWEKFTNNTIESYAFSIALTKTARYALITTGASNRQVILPTTDIPDGTSFYVGKVDSGIGYVSVVVEGGGTVNGSSNFIIDYQDTGNEFIKTGSNYFLADNYQKDLYPLVYGVHDELKNGVVLGLWLNDYLGNGELYVARINRNSLVGNEYGIEIKDFNGNFIAFVVYDTGNYIEPAPDVNGDVIDLITLNLGDLGGKILINWAKVVDGEHTYTNITGRFSKSINRFNFLAEINFNFISPDHIFISNNDILGDLSRNDGQLLYLQYFIKDKINVYFDSEKNHIILNKQPQNTIDVETDTVDFVLGEYPLSIDRISSKTSMLESEFPKVLYIGDSIAAQTKLNGSFVGGGNMWSFAKELSQKNYIDNTSSGYDYLCIGINNLVDNNIDYKETSVNVRGFAVGYGGWAAFTYLRHPFYMWINWAGAWDLLGLATLHSRSYNGTRADDLTIADTNYGVNTPVVSEDSYDLLVNRSEIADLGAWTNSVPQNTAVNDWIADQVAGNSTNPFFDIDKVGTNRFSLQKFYDSYKTLNDDGVTRLTVGLDAGTRVVDINDYDVCTPTHIVLGVGENDRSALGLPSATQPSDWTEVVDNIIELADEIALQDSAIKVGITLTGIPAPMFPERFENYEGAFATASHGYKIDMYSNLQDRFGNIASQDVSGIYLVPIWYVMTPLSQGIVRDFEDVGGSGELSVSDDDPNHPGYFGQRGCGLQVYSWVNYTYK